MNVPVFKDPEPWVSRWAEITVRAHSLDEVANPSQWKYEPRTAEQFMDEEMLRD